MENFLFLLVPIGLIFLLLRIIALPMKLAVKLAVNSLCGFVCLWLLNSISGFTGFYFPVNLVTAAVAGFLGLPGIILLILAQLLL